MGQLDELATDAVSPRRGQQEAGRLVFLFASARLIVRGVRCWCYATDAAAWSPIGFARLLSWCAHRAHTVVTSEHKAARADQT